MSDKIYWRDYEYAKDHGQTEAFVDSHLRNGECSKAIQKAIADNFDGYRLNKAAAESVIKEFGFTRTMAVSAQIIRALDHDGRISDDTKAWAAVLPVLHESGKGTYISSHPGLLGIFSEEVRRIFEREVLKNQPDIGGKVGNYTITASVMLSNGRGFARGENPNAAAPHATWQFTEEEGKRDYYWGKYFSSRTPTELNFYERTFEQLSYGTELANPIASAEMSAEQNYNQIDGIPNNAPSAGELESQENTEEQIDLSDDAPEPAEAEHGESSAEQSADETKAAVTYYMINEVAARRAKEANSFYDYKPGSATAEYKQSVDKAAEIAESQKAYVDPMYHEKIDRLLDTYARKLADNMNHGFEIDARVPSVLIAGPSNFPVRQKEKQNSARDSNMREWRSIQSLLDKIRSTGMGGISADDPNAIKKLQGKLEDLQESQETMKAVNAYYRKHKTLDGCPDLSHEQIQKLTASMETRWYGRAADKPFESYALQNNNAEIRRTKGRIEELTRRSEAQYSGWEFDGGKVEANQEANRLQVFFDDKPDEAARKELKSKGFRWAPSVGAWQRQLNTNAFNAAGRIACIQPITGESPSELQRKSEKPEQGQKSVMERIKEHKPEPEKQQDKKHTKEKREPEH